MVRLKVRYRFMETYRAKIFQFLYGTIKRPRLRSFINFTFTFQFLYGTIKSFVFGRLQNIKAASQFLYGTIKSPRVVFILPAVTSFNSYMVRLKGPYRYILP